MLFATCFPFQCAILMIHVVNTVENQPSSALLACSKPSGVTHPLGGGPKFPLLPKQPSTPSSLSIYVPVRIRKYQPIFLKHGLGENILRSRVEVTCTPSTLQLEYKVGDRPQTPTEEKKTKPTQQTKTTLAPNT